MNEKGNTAAMVFIVGAIIVTVLFASIFFPPTPRPVKGSVSQIRNDVSLVLDKALVLGLDKLMRNGDSNLTDAWYCNQALPPDVPEVIDSSEFYFRQEIQQFIEELEEEREIEVQDGWTARLSLGFDTDPAANPQVHDVQYLSDNLPNDKATVSIENFFVRYTEGDTVKEFDLSQDIVLNYRIWYFYKKLAAWMNDNAGFLSQNACESVREAPCQLTKSTCEQGTTEDHILITEGMIESLFPMELLVESGMQKSINALNQLFEDDGQNISCSFTQLDFADNIEYHRLQYCVDEISCDNIRHCSNPELGLDWECPQASCSDEFDDFMTAYPAQGCPADEPASRPDWLFSAANQPNDPVPPDFASKPSTPDTGVKIDVRAACSNFKVENITVRPEAQALFSVECVDKNASISGVSSIGFLTNQFEVRLALKLNCECNNGTPEDPFDDQLGCGESPGDQWELFREIPCSASDPLLCVIGPNGGNGNGNGRPPGLCPEPCNNRPNSCYDYHCEEFPPGSGVYRCVEDNYLCGESDYCSERFCADSEDNDAPCSNPNDPNSSCECVVRNTPENIACRNQSTPCTWFYCRASDSSCRQADRCSGSNACKQQVCLGRGTGDERCVWEDIMTCDGSSDNDPCTEDLSACYACRRNDPYCNPGEEGTCHKLRCNRFSSVCVPTGEPPGYECVPIGGG